MRCARRFIAVLACSLGFVVASGGGIGQTVSRSDDRPSNFSRPIPGRVIVSIFQEPYEADYFATSNSGAVTTKYDAGVLSQLKSYSIKNARKALYRGTDATYALEFDAAGQEDEIIRYLRCLPNVRYAQRDYTVEFLAEPNDFFYQPDSTAPLAHWIPDTLNIMCNGIGLGRTCEPYDECCPVEELWYHTFQIRDSLHLSDNWYLQHLQANKAWDIEKGRADVKIMIMDSGIAIEHPDLSANIWSNPDGDPEGDRSGDGLPGTKGQDIDGDGGRGFNDPEVGKSDANSSGDTLWGSDHICDCGPDGDYGFGGNGIDDIPYGPGGGEDDTLIAGPGNDPWDDNLRGPGSLHPELPFDDDMGDVVLMKNDDNEDGYPDDFCGQNFYDPWNTLVPREDGCPNSANSTGCHGTEMAGIVGAVTNNGIGMAGMVWNCKLVAAKIAVAYPESSPAGSVLPIARALYYAIDRGIDVVNMSFGVEGAVWDHPVINAAIDSAHVHGVIMLAGAGNEHREQYLYPCSNPHVICISGCNRLDHEALGISYSDSVDACGVVSDPQSEDYSQCGGEDLPGDCHDRGAECMVTAYLPPPQPIFNWGDPSLPYGYAATSLATSGATAQASGLAALLTSLYPKTLIQEIFPQQYSGPFYANWIKKEIERGCVPISGENADKLGAGRINAYRSLTQWGRIRTDTTWASFAYVSADIKVDEGKTLTIEPGTTIYFAPEDNDNLYDPTVVEFRVDGTLIAEGTESNPIVFKSLSETPEPGDWAGIQVVGAAASASLAYCNISDAYHGIKSYRPLQLSHCDISNCEVHGIYLEGSGASGSEIIVCSADSNGSCGIMVNSAENISIRDCESNNGYRGIWLTASTGISLENTMMKLNTHDGLKAVSSSSASIDSCTVEDNGQQGIYLSESTAGISQTHIWKNDANGLYCAGSGSDPELWYSKIEMNATGVRAISPACPILGDIEQSLGQNNTIYNQSIYVYGHDDCCIMAENCFWGTKPGKPPSPLKFVGDADYCPWLDDDPVPYLAPSAPPKLTAFWLAQNYPNPWFGGGITRIGYSIPRGNERVRLAIYDVSGRRIRTLVDGSKGAGTYEVCWDGRGDRGSRAAPGIYFYKLTAGRHSISKKLILFR